MASSSFGCCLFFLALIYIQTIRAIQISHGNSLPQIEIRSNKQTPIKIFGNWTVIFPTNQSLEITCWARNRTTWDYSIIPSRVTPSQDGGGGFIANLTFQIYQKSSNDVNIYVQCWDATGARSQLRIITHLGNYENCPRYWRSNCFQRRNTEFFFRHCNPEDDYCLKECAQDNLGYEFEWTSLGWRSINDFKIEVKSTQFGLLFKDDAVYGTQHGPSILLLAACKHKGRPKSFSTTSLIQLGNSRTLSLQKFSLAHSPRNFSSCQNQEDYCCSNLPHCHSLYQQNEQSDPPGECKNDTLAVTFLFGCLDYPGAFFVPNNEEKLRTVQLTSQQRRNDQSKSIELECRAYTFLYAPNFTFYVSGAVTQHYKFTTLKGIAGSSEIGPFAVARLTYQVKKNDLGQSLKFICEVPSYVNASEVATATAVLSVTLSDTNQSVPLVVDAVPHTLTCNAPENGSASWKIPSTVDANQSGIARKGKSIEIQRLDPALNGTYSCLRSFGGHQEIKNYVVTIKSLQIGSARHLPGNWVTNNPGILFGASFGLFLIVIAVLYCWCRGFPKCTIQRQRRKLVDQEIQEFRQGTNLANSFLRISREVASPFSVPFVKEITSAKYEMVFPGKIQNRAVLIRTTDMHTTTEYFKALLKDIKVMHFVGAHPNIVEFLGADVDNIKDRIIYALFEKSPIGDVGTFLREHSSSFVNTLERDEHAGGNIETCPNNVSTITLLNWCEQIAGALRYMQNHKLVHGDLCARNVFLFSNNCVRVSDLCSWRKDYERQYHFRNFKLPPHWKWMSIELLRSKEFTHKSDIWAFAVTAWELFSLGQEPYEEIYLPPLSFVQKLEDGYRMDMPAFANRQIYEVMLSAWYRYPNDRADALQLKNDLAECKELLLAK